MEKKGVSHIRSDKISVMGFKSLLHEQSIEIKPITILAGANSSGKSSIMQPLLLLKQTIEAPYDPGALLLHGPNVRITSADQLLSKISPSKCSDRFSLSYVKKDGWMIKITFKKYPRRGLDIENMVIKHERSSDEFVVKPDMSSEEILAIPIIPDEIKTIIKHQKIGERKFSIVVLRDRCFLSLQLFMGEGDKRNPLFGFPFLGDELIPPLKNQIEKIIHVPALRGNPERTYKTTSVGDNYPGTFEDYVASIIHYWKKNKSDKLDQLGHALEQLGLTWKVEPKSVDDTQVELQVGRLPHAIRGGAYDLVNIADVGFGLSQIIPVIVSIFIAKPDHIVYLVRTRDTFTSKGSIFFAVIIFRCRQTKS